MRIAAIDIGSNSVHMIVVESDMDVFYEVIDREKDMVRLGAGAFAKHRLREESMANCIDTMVKFRHIMDRHRVDSVVAVATSAVREAANGEQFLKALHDATGIAPRVITGRDEARLIHLAVRSSIELGHRRGLIFDIGGGSVEVVVGDSRSTQVTETLPLGVLRLRERVDPMAPLPREARRDLEDLIRAESAAALELVRRGGFELAIGTSGTILNLGLAALLRRGSERSVTVHGRTVTLSEMRDFVSQLCQLDGDGRCRIEGVDSDRADTIHLGGVLLVALMELAGARQIILCDAALREGLVQDTLEREAEKRGEPHQPVNICRRSVQRLMRRCGRDGPHERLIAQLALSIFDQTKALHGLGPPERQLLDYAALLHDVGRFVGFERHEQHSYYLIRSGLRGFTDDDLKLIALIARFHRKAKPRAWHPEFAQLTGREQRIVSVLSALVRFVEGLDRRHIQCVSAVYCEASARRLRIRVVAQGEADVEVWSAQRKASPLGRALDRKIDVELDGTGV